MAIPVPPAPRRSKTVRLFGKGVTVAIVLIVVFACLLFGFLLLFSLLFSGVLPIP